MNKKLIVQELLRRSKARKNLLNYYLYTKKNYIPGKHFETICEKLEDILNTKTKRLMISLPPQHGKSETCSVRFPAYYLSKFPDKRVVLTSYSLEQALKQSRRCREVFFSEANKRLFPQSVPLINSKQFKTSDKEWETSERGSYYAVGIEGPLTGRGFDIGIIDDFLKDRIAANSELQKNRILDWYKSVFLTRQSPDAAIIIIATRWATDDLIGHLLEHSGEKWDVIKFPAINKEGEALWPAQYDIQTLNAIKAEQGAFEWSALYQQEPVIHGGNRFKTENIVWEQNLDDYPKDIEYVRAWDMASSSKERNKPDPDYTVGILGGVKHLKGGLWELWIKDIVRGQLEAPERNNLIINTSKKDGAFIPAYIEAFGAYKDAYTILKRILAGKSSVRKSLPPGDKTTKIEILEPPLEVKNIHILDNNKWKSDIIKQFVEFPYSKHDDILDAMALIAHEQHKEKTKIIIPKNRFF